VLPVIFTPAARAELIGAQDWYESEAPGLGRRFRAEIGAVVQRLTDNPRQFPVVHRDVRRAKVRKFPYTLFFRMEADAVMVIACFHSSRDPRRWQSRA